MSNYNSKTIIDKCEINKNIDFLSLDVEGYELGIERIKP